MTRGNPFHPDQHHRRADATPPAVDAYLDARGARRQARSMLDEVCRDASVLDDLARDREWIDEVRSPAPAPDLTDRILGRLGVDATHFDRRRHRFVLRSRRLSAAAALALAFVVGMWARSSLVPAPATRAVETAHRFERILESLPIQMNPLEPLRVIMLEVGSTLAEPEAQPQPAAPPASAARRTPADLPRHAPVRTTTKDRLRPDADQPGLFLDEEIDVESLKAIYRDLGIV